MAHLIDDSKGFNAYVGAQPAWHGLGQVLVNPISAIDALQQGGLDYEVLKLPNIHSIPHEFDNSQDIFIVSDDSFFTFRTDVRKVLGTRLGRDYEVMQNIEALNIVDEILGTGAATIETAGAIDGGKKVFICLKVNKDIIVGGNDTIKQYVLLCNSHDGSLSITAMPTNVRVVCNNTLGAALRAGRKERIKIRHTANANERLREASKVLHLISENTEVNTENYEKMRATMISREEMWNYFGNLFLSEKEIKEIGEKKRKPEDILGTKKKNIIEGVQKYAADGAGQTLAMRGGNYTMWSAYNAVTGYVSRKKFDTDDARANNMLFGSGAEVIEQAGVLALNKSKIIQTGLTDFHFNFN